MWCTTLRGTSQACGLPGFLSHLCNNSTEPWNNVFRCDLLKDILMGCLSYWTFSRRTHLLLLRKRFVLHNQPRLVGPLMRSYGILVLVAKKMNIPFFHKALFRNTYYWIPVMPCNHWPWLLSCLIPSSFPIRIILWSGHGIASSSYSTFY